MRSSPQRSQIARWGFLVRQGFTLAKLWVVCGAGLREWLRYERTNRRSGGRPVRSEEKKGLMSPKRISVLRYGSLRRPGRQAQIRGADINDW